MKLIYFIVFLVIILLVCIILISNVRIYLHYQQKEKDNFFKIELRALFGLIKYSVDVPKIKVDDDSPSILMEQEIQSSIAKEKLKNEAEKHVGPDDVQKSIHDIHELIEHIVHFKNIIKEFLKKIEVHQFEWRTVIGVNDAALTGIVAGALWTLKGGSVGIISHFMKLKSQPIIEITPNFQNLVSSTSFKCMLQVRIGNAILAGIKLLKYWKGNIPNFKSDTLSKINKANGKQSMS